VRAVEEVAAHTVLALGVTDDGSTAEHRRRLRLIASLTPRFWPEM
jgi:hypothetical protein